MMKTLELKQKTEDNAQVTISQVQIDKEYYYKISNSDVMKPFFMSIVSDANHWMFISSNGGLSAGRKNANFALFPYYTDDKITESVEVTGSKTIFWVQKGKQQTLWEPFSDRYEGMYEITRNLYKHVYGNKLIFEEINHDLKLTYRYQWNSSDKFGFVRKSTLTNNSAAKVTISLLDGLQNIMPYGVESDLQNGTSNLVDAYKRSELVKEVGLGIYALSAIIVDRAEPSEALKANIAWSVGFDHPTYFIHAQVALTRKASKEWMIVANVNQTHSAIAQLSENIKENKQIASIVQADIEEGTKRLVALNANADGLQLTADNFRDSRHFSNTLFNIMRGGIFDHNYQIEKQDFSGYLAKANKKSFQTAKTLIDKLPELFSLSTLKDLAEQSSDADFKRLCLEYMPLKFSRRHGDPSRPWNKFSINTQSELDGSKILDYQGNWRDIFQNWEALALSYPEFIESMIHKFLNATTFDGYNPYRVTKDGFDWEAIEPDNPWSYIGYWGDHQIIYLLKYLEFIEDHNPGRLKNYFKEDVFVYANVPYKIKPYEEILKNPKDTIGFDHELDTQIRQIRSQMGADGALLQNAKGEVYKVNFIEKILASLLAKLSNFIPEGGIWLNTQRPEWNDANNALVGNGVSMVTLYYMRRYFQFFQNLFASTKFKKIPVSKELAVFFNKIVETFDQNQELLKGPINDKDRKSILDALGQAGSDFRAGIYEQSFSGKKKKIKAKELQNFVTLSLQYLDHSIEANKRGDNLYHAYNLMTVESDKEVSVSYLSEMLEGQVAVLSSGYLSPKEALAVLDALKSSKLFRPDQYSYILYPNKNLPGFLAKNKISPSTVAKSSLLKKLVKKGNAQIIEKDVNGDYHFNGNFRNADDVKKALEQLSTTEFASLAVSDKEVVLQAFEGVFDHKSFTGRSGTFFGYEGLGSIYWHMVSKLLLAVQECCLDAIEKQESAEVIGRLLEHYYEINAGIGVHKSPQLYGAFPTDPYSHTPAGRGAQQPGMTGQVKEDILSRFGELGVFVKAGKLHFEPTLLRKDEFLKKAQVFEYIDVQQQTQQIKLKKNMLCFTYCQVPIIYQLAAQNSLEVLDNKKEVTIFEATHLDLETSQHLFDRTGKVTQIIVHVKETDLR